MYYFSHYKTIIIVICKSIEIQYGSIDLIVIELNVLELKYSSLQSPDYFMKCWNRKI